MYVNLNTFMRELICKFVFRFIVGNEDSFFPNAQRSRIVHWILSRTNYEDGAPGKCKFGMSLAEGCEGRFEWS